MPCQELVDGLNFSFVVVGLIGLILRLKSDILWRFLVSANVAMHIGRDAQIFACCKLGWAYNRRVGFDNFWE